MASQGPKDHHNPDEIKGIIKLLRIARWLTWAASVVLGTVFAGFELQGISIGALLPTNPTLVTKFSVLFCYFSWIVGMMFDTKLHEAVYVSDPSRGRLKASAYGTVAILVGVGILLALTRNDPHLLALAITALSVASLFAIKPLLKTIEKPSAESALKYVEAVKSDSQHFYSLEQLNVVQYYLKGDWVLIRSIGLLALILLIDVVCFVDPVNEWVRAPLARLSPNIDGPLLSALLVAAFLVFAEGTQWYMRIKTRLSIHLLAMLREQYKIEPLTVQTPREKGQFRVDALRGFLHWLASWWH